jgi:nitrogen-specific signal transduction histidine kinase
VHGFDGGAAGASILARDVTQQRQLEEQLHQSQKLEAIGALAGGIAHDFNNLLVAIQGNAELLLDGDDRPSRHVLEIRSAAQRASELTQQLLAFSRKQALQPQPVDVDDLVEETRQLLTRIVGDDVLLTSRCGDAGSVLADPARLGQVIVNLVVNARDAMPNGGTVSIATDRVELTSAEAVALGLEAPGDYVRIVVADTGTGMDAETRRRALEPFFTTKPKGSGTGLGLSTALGTVKQSGGSLTIESHLGRGTTIRVYLPALAVQSDAPVADAAPASTRGDESVLLVEDDVAVRLVIGEALAASGYKVTAASCPDEALELSDDTDRIDLVLSDLALPGMDGLELTRRVRSRHPEAKVVLTSGRDGGGANGEATFLQKPFSLGELAATVRAALDA